MQLQARYFKDRGAAGQSRFQPSLAFTGEIVADVSDADQIVFTPFARVDVEDAERTHADFRELYWSHLEDRWELNVGLRQVFWGVAEFHHLVDTINQTDGVENVDDEDRLGQPMVQLSFVRDWGLVDVFLLTGFRERTFAGRDGRPRFPARVDADRAEYESGADAHRLDGAVRWSSSYGGLDVGVHVFSGTNRDPRFRYDPASERLIPVYDVIDQAGVDAQYLTGPWAFKAEALARNGDGHGFAAAVVGFERTFVGVFGSNIDLGVVGEYLYDGRDEEASFTLYERDVALGARLTFNDFNDTNLLFGFIRDTRSQERIFSLEAERQMGTDWSMSLETRVFSGEGRGAFLDREDFFQIELTRFF